MSNIKDATVLITGGASGIGKLMGELCLQQGARRLIIWDIDEIKSAETAESLRRNGFEVHTYILNLEHTEEIIKAAKDVLEKYRAVDLLFNNAGVVVGRNFVEHTHRDIDFTTNININALMHVTMEFLPSMISRGKGHIINIASAAGLMAVPKMSVYVASKHAVVGWSESLRLELEAVSKELHVTTVTPSYINTGMFEGVRSPVVPLVKPERAAKKILNGVKRNKLFVRMPGIVYIVPFVKGILPQRWFDVVAGKWFGFYKSMITFKGRN
jgi:short-subunit dehydrogenase